MNTATITYCGTLKFSFAINGECGDFSEKAQKFRNTYDAQYNTIELQIFLQKFSLILIVLILLAFHSILAKIFEMWHRPKIPIPTDSMQMGIPFTHAPSLPLQILFIPAVPSQLTDLSPTNIRKSVFAYSQFYNFHFKFSHVRTIIPLKCVHFHYKLCLSLISKQSAVFTGGFRLSLCFYPEK